MPPETPDPMREYARISPLFWIKGTGRSLRGDKAAQLLAIYLMSNQHAERYGLYYLSQSIMAEETGLALPEVDQALCTLELGHFLSYDRKEALVFVHNMAAYQIGDELTKTNKQRTWLLKELLKYGAHPFVQDFWMRYEQVYHLGPMPELAPTSKQRPLIGVNVGGLAEPPKAPKKPMERAPRSYMTAEWQPSDEQLAHCKAHKIDIEAVLSDFRNYWLAEGKPMANWNACFRQNVDKIIRTDWLLQRYLERPKSKPVEDPKTYGPAAEPPPELLERLQNFAKRPNNSLLEEAKRIALQGGWTPKKTSSGGGGSTL